MCRKKSSAAVVSANWFLGQESVPISSDTTADGKQAFLIIGDSTGAGRTTGGEVGPTASAGILYEYNGVDLTQLTTAEVSTANTGSPWKQFGITYNSNFGNKVVLIAKGSAGSNFYPDGDNNNWYTSGDLYTPAKTAANDCLAFLGITKLKGVFVMLGVNDVRAATTIANIQTGIDSFMTRIQADFPDTPILMILPGTTEVTGNSLLLSQTRDYLIQKAKDNTNVYVVAAGASLRYGGYFDTDTLHYNQNGNNEIGKMFVRWYNNSSYTNKWVRAVISNHFDDLSTNRKNLISTFVTNQINNGNYWKLEHLSVHKTTIEANLGIDWSFMGQVQKSGSPVFTANNNVASDGSSNHILPTTNASVQKIRASQNDGILGQKLKTRVTASGVAAVFYGGGNATASVTVQQTTTNVAYRYNDNTITTMADASFDNDTLYSVARNGGTKYLIKNTAVAASAVVASTGETAILTVLGALNNNGTIQLRFAGEYEYTFMAKYSDFDLASFYSDIETLIDNW
jgi:hypothetical protein